MSESMAQTLTRLLTHLVFSTVSPLRGLLAKLMTMPHGATCSPRCRFAPLLRGGQPVLGLRLLGGEAPVFPGSEDPARGLLQHSTLDTRHRQFLTPALRLLPRFPFLFVRTSSIVPAHQGQFMERQIMSARQMDLALARVAAEIVEAHSDLENVLFMGIRRRGIPLSERLQKHVQALTQKTVQAGVLDITLYRDDLTMIAAQPVVETTRIDAPVEGKKVILVDDVLYTGRTVRAALDLLIDYGRPSKVELAVLVDRGHRELPIQADYVGKQVETADDEVVEVQIPPVDKAERVMLTNRESAREKRKLST